MNGTGGSRVADRSELAESALGAFAEGVVLADMGGRIAFWNLAAQTITGHSAAEIVSHGVREVLDKLIVGGSRDWIRQTTAGRNMDRNSREVGASGRGALIHIRHKEGHGIPALVRIAVLRDGLGERIGTEVLFHPVESIDALPRGESGEESRVDESASEFEERLTALHRDFLEGDSPLSVLWVTIDQERGLRRTHGAQACEAMLEKMERTLVAGLKPAQEIRRWGEDAFLIVAHERSTTMLGAHAQVLAGLARTTDFRWWGDRISLTVSIGAAQAECGESLSAFLERAQTAMLVSIRKGGNQVTTKSGRDVCSPS
jgi:PAS domain S-box-containing protein